MKSPRRFAILSGLTLLAASGLAAGVIVLSGCAAFGSKPEGDRLARARQSPEWHDDRFEDPQGRYTNVRGAWLNFLFGPDVPDAAPAIPVDVVHDDASTFAAAPASGLRVTWFGHSSALVEIDGARVLIDPFWGERASPVAFAGPQRWYPPVVALDDLPPIDAVVISHDHYDHLDLPTIAAMRRWRSVFVVPLGVGAHLAGWGIPQSRIIELDWWQSTSVGSLEVVATPSRHSSGRLSVNSNQTLWAGYAFIGQRHRVWYSGDTGFHDDLPKIGARYGPFDAALVESGQYDARWPDNHLGPEQAVAASRLVRADVMIPVHWALIKLAMHAWTEPAERVTLAARCQGVNALIPRPGQAVEPTTHPVIERWWPGTAWHGAAERPIVATRDGQPQARMDVPACIAPAR